MYDLGIKIDCFNPKVLYTFIKKFDKNNTCKTHKHDFLTISYILSGSCTYEIDNIPYKTKKGNILIINSNTNHCKTFDNNESITEFQIGFDNVKLENLPRNHIIEENKTPKISVTDNDGEILKYYNEIMLQQGKCKPGSALILKALGMELLVSIIRCLNSSEVKKDKGLLNIDTYDKETIVNSISEFINKNYMNEISLDIISKNMYLSPTYISKTFKESTGDSPINYLIKVRLSKARELLKSNDYSIKQVAKMVGYSDAYYFSKLYKKHYGYAPSKDK